MQKKRKLDNSSPKISVIIPSYNKVHFIRKTLESIISQRYSNLEVIVQDGGSTDGTLEIIKELASKYPKSIFYESRKDNGQTDAINKGFRKASGEIITFINADDIYLEGSFDTVAKAFLANHDTFWLAGYGRVINTNGDQISKLVTMYKNVLLTLNYYPLLLVLNYLMQPSVFLTRLGYKEVSDFVGHSNYVMEYHSWLRLGKRHMPVVINSYLSGFRMYPENISSSSARELLSEDMNIVKRFTHNPIIIFLHYLNNLGRIILLKLFN